MLPQSAKKESEPMINVQWTGCLALALLFGFRSAPDPGQGSAAAVPAVPLDGKQLVLAMVEHEHEAAAHRGHYLYLSEERSDRTGGHLWRERRAETNWGIVKYLLAEDGKPLSCDRLRTEKERLAGEADDPDAFRKQENKADEDTHAQTMLTLLSKAFLFSAPQPASSELRVQYRPDPAYAPQSVEERVLHSMNGTVAVDAKSLRLASIDGTVPGDVSLGFGPLATVHAGSNFATTREHVQANDWKTVHVHTEIKGKALFIKSIARVGDAHHEGFQKIPQELSVRDAVALLER